MIFESRSFLKIVNCLIIYSVAVINLPINTIKTAGIAIPIKGTKIEGKRFEKSDGITL
tara:strand:- start:69 stop:242 length:174 start_codon:yes stop_codon:yes gene_type:complete